MCLPESLHYALGSGYEVKKNSFRILSLAKISTCLLVTSEKLSHYEAGWNDVPPNSMLVVNRNLNVEICPL